jgi:DNA-binding NarL/FixJ family response regulator
MLIVDDSPRFRASARRLMEAAGVEVVGEAEDGASALEAARRLRPAVVLLDVGLPDTDGFDVAARLAEELPEAAVVLTSSDDWSDAEHLVRDSGARGFLGKQRLTPSAVLEVAG